MRWSTTSRGAHLPFHDALPQWAMNTEGDLCVTSVHRMGAGVEQSSVFHLQGDRVDPAVLKAREDLLGTTSATSLVYAALDGWRRQMVEQGKQLLDDLLDLVAEVRTAIRAIPGLSVMGAAEFPGVYEFDPLKIVVDVSGAGISGYQAADRLRARQRVTVGLSDHRRVVAGCTVADSARTGEILVRALTAVASAGLPRPSTVDLPDPAELELETAMLPRDAFFGPAEQVPVERAAGRVAAEMVTPYPPGAPALVPGEVITRPVLDYLRSGLAAGMQIPDPADPTLDTVRVVARAG